MVISISRFQILFDTFRDKIIAKEMGWDDLLEDLEAYERGEIPDDEEDIDDIMDEDLDEGVEWKKQPVTNRMILIP